MSFTIDLKFEGHVIDVSEVSCWVNYIIFQMDDDSLVDMCFDEQCLLPGDSPDTARLFIASPDFPPLWSEDHIIRWLERIKDIHTIKMSGDVTQIKPMEIVAFESAIVPEEGSSFNSPVFIQQKYDSFAVLEANPDAIKQIKIEI